MSEITLADVWKENRKSIANRSRTVLGYYKNVLDGI